MENKNIKTTNKIMKNSANNTLNKDNMNNNKKTQSNRNMKRNIITFMLAALIIGLIGFSSYIRTVDFSVDSSNPQAKAIEDAKAKAQAELEKKKEAEFRKLLLEKENERVSEIKSDYKAKFAQIIEEAQRNINKTISSKVSVARDQVSPTAEKFRSVSVLKDILWYQAKDIAFSSNEANTCIENLIGDNLINACVDAQASVNSNLDYLVLRLNEEANNMQSDLVEGIPEQLKTPDYELSLTVAVVDIYNSAVNIKKSSYGLGGSVSGLIMDGVFIYFERGTFKAIATRVAATITTSTVLVVADGPLPVLDIASAVFGAGCLAWTAWDLYWLSDEAADSVKSDLNKTLNSFEKDLKASANTAIEQIKSQLEKANS